MRIQIATPAGQGKTLGNRITATRWAKLLRSQGHRVSVTDGYSGESVHCLIAIHARRSSAAIVSFKRKFPLRPVVVCLSGTDIHGDLRRSANSKERRLALKSLEAADRVVLLEPAAMGSLDKRFRKKAYVIVQSAQAVTTDPKPLKRSFEVSLVGHLRKEKDPFLVIEALKLLPAESNIKVTHLGTALEPGMKRAAEKATARMANYRWLGGKTHGETQRLIARSRLMILTSRIEGAPSVISEAIVNQVPILATRITATEGLLGKGYPGLFPVGAARRLARLLSKAELDSTFYRRLSQAVKRLRPKFTPVAESNDWRELLKQISNS